MLARPARYNKLKQQTLKNKSDRLRTDLDPFIGVLRLAKKNSAYGKLFTKKNMIQ